MMYAKWLFLGGLMTLAGCGSNAPANIDEPIKVTGTVLSKAGVPVGDVALNLQPLETGYARTIEVRRDGTFVVETQPGPYAYFFSPKPGAKRIPSSLANYLQASLERTVVVADNTVVKILVD